MGNTCCPPTIDQEWVSSKMLKSEQHQIACSSIRQASSISNNQYIILKSKKGLIFSSSFYYEGEIKHQMANGKGFQFIKLQKNQQAYYHGNFVNNKRHGYGKYQEKQRKLEFSGQWIEGLPYKGTLIIDNLKFQISKIEFDKQNIDHGTIKLKITDKCQYTGQFVKKQNNQYYFQGQGKMIFANSLYQGQFKDGKFNGKGRYQNKETNQAYEGMYKDGKKDGEGKYYLCSSKYMEGKWVQGKKQGLFRQMQKNRDGVFEYKGDVLFKNNIRQNFSSNIQDQM